MDCPVCKNAMVTLELENVEIDYCTDCGGIWLDAGELELLIGDPEKARDLIETFKSMAHSSESVRKCPICDRKMQKIIVGTSKPVLLIEKCSKGDGLWFDRSELYDIFNIVKLDNENKIQMLLTNMFGHDHT